MTRFGSFVALLLALLVPVAGAQPEGAATPPPVAGGPGALDARRDGAWTLVAGDDLARALGAAWSDDGRAFTLRAPQGVLTAFAGEADALWQPAGGEAQVVPAALPAQRVDGRWFLPEDLLGVLGARVDGATLRLPGGGARPLALPAPPATATDRAEVVALGPGVEALRLFAPSVDGEAAVSLLAVDLGLLALAFPEQRAALDGVLRELGDVKALFLTVTAVAEAAWQPAVYVVQDGRETLLSAPFSVQVLAGEPDRVTADAPVVAVAFLPVDVDLRRPLTLRWAGASGTWTLRR